MFHAYVLVNSDIITQLSVSSGCRSLALPATHYILFFGVIYMVPFILYLIYKPSALPFMDLSEGFIKSTTLLDDVVTENISRFAIRWQYIQHM